MRLAGSTSLAAVFSCPTWLGQSTKEAPVPMLARSIGHPGRESEEIEVGLHKGAGSVGRSMVSWVGYMEVESKVLISLASGPEVGWIRAERPEARQAISSWVSRLARLSGSLDVLIWVELWIKEASSGAYLTAPPPVAEILTDEVGAEVVSWCK